MNYHYKHWPHYAGNPYNYFTEQTELNREQIFEKFDTNSPSEKYIIFDWNKIFNISGSLLNSEEILSLDLETWANKGQQFKEMASVYDLYYKVPKMDKTKKILLPSHTKLEEGFLSPLHYLYPNESFWRDNTLIPNIVEYFDTNIAEIIMSKIIIAPPDTIITNHRGQINSMNFENDMYITKIFLPIQSNAFSYWFIEDEPIQKREFNAIWCDTEKCWHNAFNLGPTSTTTLILTIKYDQGFKSWINRLKKAAIKIVDWEDDKKLYGYTKP